VGRRSAPTFRSIERREIRVVPPTLLTLEDLAESHARHGGLEAMLEAERGRAAPPVMPRIDVEAGAIRVVMPWDPGYYAVQGEGCRPPERYPAHLAQRRSCIVVPLSRESR
jgi:hypothetical protein